MYSLFFLLAEKKVPIFSLDAGITVGAFMAGELYKVVTVPIRYFATAQHIDGAGELLPE